MPGDSLILRGRIAAKMGENIDTDIIYPGRYLNVTDREKTAEHLFELAYPELRAALRPGDIIVAAKNFGCGSSREQAAAALKYAGIGAVIAPSFARIFYRNSINLGLPAIVSAEAPAVLEAGDEIEIDLARGFIRKLPAGPVCPAAALDPRAIELLNAGGLIPYLKRKHAA
ncbi:MAG: 3-isopropylmalate dehydratase small subunit [Bryobacteraceae bacterium]